NQSFPRTRTVSRGAQSGSIGSECKHGHAGFPQVRPQRSHCVKIDRLLVAARTLATSLPNSLLSFVCRLNPSAFLSRTQICVRSLLNGSLVPLRSHSSISMRSSTGLTKAPKLTPFGSFHSELNRKGPRIQSTFSITTFLSFQIVGTCVCARNSRPRLLK